MKSFKKMFAIVMILSLCLALAIPALADEDTYTITINNDATGHTYEAYQIFTGTYDSESGQLQDIYWGNGITDAGKTALGDAAAVSKTLTDETALKEFAASLEENGYLTNATTQTSGKTTEAPDAVYEIAGLASGYYLVKDQDNTLDDTNDSYTSYIVKVLGGDTNATPKSGTPNVEKKVLDVDDTTGENVWGDSADHDLGDYVEFTLTASFADVSNFDDYETYALTFTDTMSKGLVYGGEGGAYHSEYSVTLFTGDVATDITSAFTLTQGTASDTEGAYAGGSTLTFACNDIKALGATKTSTIVVSYNAMLTTDANIGADGNPNKVDLTYSNNPNGEGTGKTLEDEVIVFTFQTIVNKVNSNGESLAGAEFALYKVVNGKDDPVAIAFVTVDENGDYILSETDNVEVNTETITIGEGDAAVTKDPGTVFTFKYLDAGDYILSETKAPAGYNAIDDITFTIAAEHNGTDVENAGLQSLAGTDAATNVTFTADASAGSLTTDIVNNSGTVLPSTGGVGTTITCVIGAILVIGAGVVLVARKRVTKA
jgi:fimbrial isopeptide formation D2 family protein/LPXTG-motif cell wall-anchored protein